MAATITDAKIHLDGASSTSNSQGAENGIDDGNSTSDQPYPYLLTREGRRNYMLYGVPLYRAAMKGDVEDVVRIISENPQVMQEGITEGMETVFHITALVKQVPLAEKLVGWIQVPNLQFTLRLKNKDGNTALSYAAISGIVALADLMINSDAELPNIRNNAGVTPLHLAALLGHREMVWRLYDCTKDGLTYPELHGIFIICIRTGLYDIAFRMQNDNPRLATTRGSDQEIALHVLAQKPLLFSINENRLGLLRRIFSCSDVAFPMQNQDPQLATTRGSDHETALHVLAQKPLLFSIIENQLGILRRIISGSGVNRDSLELHQNLRLVKSLWEKVLDHEEMWSLIEHPTVLILDAAQSGNIEFLVQLINLYPDLIWRVNAQNQSTFHYAILYRHESIFSLIHEVGSIKDLIATYKDGNKNNMLHLAARLPPQNRLNIVSGAALQMQRELLWFQEVESVVQPSCREQRNNGNFTPWELFMKEHKGLMKEGEDWMKKTAESLLMVPTLIAAIVFASIFTVPGGTNDNSGEPNFVRSMYFMVFVTSDAMALFSSLASILMFLSILTSRYTEDDFVKRLPFMLMIGLATLFISIGSMMVAFSATVFIIFHHGKLWVPVVIAILVSMPMALFASINFPLFIDVWNSTYGLRSLFHPQNRLFKQS